MQSPTASHNAVLDTNQRRLIHPPHRAPRQALQSAIDRLHDALAVAPALPNFFPQPAELLRRCAQILSDEMFPAAEVLARPLDDALKALRDVFCGPERGMILWGIGTMTSREAALRSVELKPDFLVSPAFCRSVLEVAVEAGIPYIPAVLTFQDVQNVLDSFDEFGLKPRVLKLCPIFNITPQYVQALIGCFPGISFCPTGEITLDNFLYWKRVTGIIAPMGAELTPSDLLARRDFHTVRERLQLLRSLSDVAQTELPPK